MTAINQEAEDPLVSESPFEPKGAPGPRAATSPEAASLSVSREQPSGVGVAEGIPLTVQLREGVAVADLTVVIRVVSDFRGKYSNQAARDDVTPREFEAQILAALVEPSRFEALGQDLANAVQDAMGDGFTAARLSIRPRGSFELVFLVVTAYNVIVRFNEVMEALRRAALNIDAMVYEVARVMGIETTAVNTRWSLSSELASLLAPPQAVPAGGGAQIMLLSWRRVLGALAVVTYLAALVVGFAFGFSRF